MNKLIIGVIMLLAAHARAQEQEAGATTTQLAEPQKEEEPQPLVPAVAPLPTEATAAATAAASVPEAHTTIAESGGLFDLGLAVAPKLGAGFGSASLAGGGGVFVVELEVGYDLPVALPRGRDLELFLSLSYSGPSTRETVDAADPRLPGDGSFDYQLTLHQAIVTYGALYRFPVDTVDWWRPYTALGARTIWSATVVAGTADGNSFGTYDETAFDVGVYAALGSDFYVGPGAVLVELQVATSLADRVVLRATNTTAAQLALGYRFYL